MKYPAGIKVVPTAHKKEDIQYGNRGMSLEHDLNITNDYYRESNRALIYKKPTPIKVKKVDYQKNSVVIKEGFFEHPSTTDYNGVYHGLYIDFEAKETLNKTSFPLHNIHPHQIEHIRGVLFQKGLVFLIVRFVKLNRTYLLFGEDFVDYIDHHDRASIPLSYFEQRGHLILDQYHPRVDYLTVIDQIYGGANESELQKEL